jgi:uncharacterized RDD family membrane protein YckC
MDNELLADYASKKIRLFNFVIDSILFWILFILTGLFIGDWIKSNFGFLIFFYFIYHLFFELLFSRTPAKLITSTRVVDENDKKPNFKTLLIRNISRLIPFDAVSFAIFDIGWHDSISKTSVINT